MIGECNREILHLAIPSIISNVTVPLLGLVDLTIVGHIGNEDYISAIAIGSMAFNVIYWLLGFLRMGTSGLTSQAYGGHNKDEIIGVLLRTITLGIGIGVFFVIIQKPLGWLLFRLMNTPSSSFHLVQDYFSIVIFGAPAMLGLYGLTGWFIGMQDTKMPMFIAIMQNIINIIASLFFVFICHWDIQGVAFGTLMSQWCGFIIGLYNIKRKLLVYNEVNLLTFTNTKKRRSKNYWHFYLHSLKEKDVWSNFFKINRDIFFRTLCLVLVNLFFTKAGGKQGAMILAVNTLLMTLFTMFSYFMDGFAYAGEALSGKYYGAKEIDKLHDLIRRLFLFGTIVVVLFTSLYVIGGKHFLSLLTSDHQVVLSSLPYLIWACLIPLMGVSAFIMDGIFIGITETKGMLISGITSAVLFFAIYYIFGGDRSNNILWIAFLIFLLVRGIVEILWAKFFHPIRIKE